MKSVIFRLYDIRGIVDQELIIDQVYDLARAIVTKIKHKHQGIKQVIVGRDGRSHSSLIHRHVCNAIIDSGLDVIDIGICPTPIVYFAVHVLDIPTGLVITASHNPKEYNGIKMWGIAGPQIQEIRTIFEEKTFTPLADNKGSIIDKPMIDDYIAYLVEQFPHLVGNNIGCVIDCGNATGSTVLPKLVTAMKWKNVKLLYDQLDGDFPHHHPDPTLPENMQDVAQALTTDSSLELGAGLDGDCDRMNPMTKNGTLIPGDKVLALFAKKVIQDIPGAGIVLDIKGSASIMKLLQEWGGKAHMAPSGHTMIKQAMAEQKALLGGELSCHFFFHDRYFGYDDGIYSILRLFEIIQQENKPLEKLLELLPDTLNSPEFRIECEGEENKAKIVDHVKSVFAARNDADLITIDGVKAHTPYGWGLVRASNTQPVISLRFEAENEQNLKQIKQDFVDALTPYYDSNELREKFEL
ncbi:MAG: phosphomannomutase/phosphoglucomutase [Epsilonproteobacteria bacterium]|nr:phosphomannomutase/phosphoglucomutase [Campylobacterota bacterium]